MLSAAEGAEGRGSTRSAVVEVPVPPGEQKGQIGHRRGAPRRRGSRGAPDSPREHEHRRLACVPPREQRGAGSAKGARGPPPPPAPVGYALQDLTRPREWERHRRSHRQHAGLPLKRDGGEEEERGVGAVMGERRRRTGSGEGGRDGERC